MKELERLQKENDELRAKLDKYNDLSIILTNLELYGEDGNVQGAYIPTKLMEEFDALRYQPQIQSLADIKAEAVMELITSPSVFEHEYTGEMLIGVGDIINYANQLKEG
jgi:hypothetical protein